MRESDSEPPDGIYQPLTNRESEILNLIAEDLSDREIAEHLVLAYTTVKWFNRQIFNKLGVNSRQEAVYAARTLGLLDSDDTTQPDRTPHNLPASLTPFVGRKQELIEVTRLLRDRHERLVTVLGVGGIGKTRLALAAARAVLSNFSDGVYFVPLVALHDPEDIVLAIAERVGYKFQPGQRSQRQQIVDYLRNRCVLLVLDNFEHLLDGGLLVADLLQAGAGVQILVTSREKLRLTGETVYRLDGMHYPQKDTTDGLDYDAVRLFEQCACRVKPGFQHNGDMAVGRICRLTEGIPLAIELAAAWVEVMSTAEIAAEITASLDFLQSDLRDLPERQRSMRAVFESTWKRLTPAECALFRRLSVFRGGCTREAALEVTESSLSALASLSDRALVVHTADGRYIIHELLRQYAEEQLAAAGEAEATHDAHSDYYTRFMIQPENDLRGGQQLEPIRQIEADWENIKVAFRRLVQRELYSDAIPFADNLGLAFQYLARRSEGRDYFASVTKTLPPAPEGELRRLLAHLLVWEGHCSVTNWNDALDLLDQGLAIAREFDDWTIVGTALVNSALRLQSRRLPTPREDFQRAESMAREALQIFREIGDKYGTTISLHTLTGFHFTENRPAEAYRLALEALTLVKNTNNVLFSGNVYIGLSQIAHECGDYLQAEFYLDQSLAVFQELENHEGLEHVNAMRGRYRFVAGDFPAAVIYFTQALSHAHKVNYPNDIAYCQLMFSLTALVQGRYADAIQAATEILHVLHKGRAMENKVARFARTVEACGRYGLEENETATALVRRHIFPCSTHLRLIEFGEFIKPFHLTGLAYLLADAGEGERALELLSLTAHNPNTPGWWLEREPLTVKLLARLKGCLSPAQYAAAWARGKSLDLNTALAALLELPSFQD
ncbi:MAG: hypothetical protein H6671_15205 [Anaerolineaceae bacterium]|nr:hypothetical protein [Anaerolineaceae bacterium]